MTIAPVVPDITFTFAGGFGSRGPFPLIKNGTPLVFYSNAEVVVMRYDTNTDMDPVLLIEGTDYNLTGGPSNGSLTLTQSQPGLLTAERLYVTTVSTLAQSLDLVAGGSFSAAALERRLDVIFQILQQHAREIKSVIRFSMFETDEIPKTTPLAAAIDKIPYITGSAEFPEIAFYPIDGGIADISAVAGSLSDIAAVAGDLTGADTIGTVAQSILTGDLNGPPISNFVYVRKNGNDNNSGRTLGSAVATIARGLVIANDAGTGYVVSVYPGTYIEDGEMVIGPGNGVVSVGGQYTTNVFASSGNEAKNMFLLNSGSYIQGFSFRNQSVDSFDNPTGGFAVAFAPGATIFRSPYVRDISQVSQYLDRQIVEPLGPELSPPNPILPRGGGTILADRAVLNQNSVFPYILAFGATPRSPNGIGYCAKNGAGINGISSVTIFQRIAFYALNGGQITLNNSGTQFGDVTFRSRGSMPVQVPATTGAALAVSTTGAAAILDNRQAVIDAMWGALVTAGYTVGQPASYETFTRRDAGNLLDSLRFDFLDGDKKVTQAYALGFFDYQGDLVFTYSTPHVPSSTTLGQQFQFAWDAIKTALYAYAPFNVAGAPRTMLDGLIQIVKDTVDPSTRPAALTFSSLIESLAHQFNNAGSGVNANALPLNFRRPGTNPPVPFTIQAEAGTGINNGVGRVRWSGADELNNQYFAGGTKINGLTGRIEGRPFNNAVRQIARRVANSQGVY